MKQDYSKDKHLSHLVGAYLETLEASTMLLQIVEREFAQVGAGLHQRAKQRNKQIQQHITALRHLTVDNVFENEHQAFNKDWYRYDDFRKDAAYFARLVLYLTDRTYGDEVFAAQIEEFIKTKAEKGIIPDTITDKIQII